MTPLTPAQSELVQAHLSIAEVEAARASRRAHRRVPWDELLGSAYYGLCKAARSHGPGEFGRYATMACRHQIMIDQERLRRNHIGVLAMRSLDAVGDQLGEPDAGGDGDDRWALLDPELDRLPAQQRKLMELRLAGHQVDQAAERMGIAPITARIHSMKAMATLRARLAPA